MTSFFFSRFDSEKNSLHVYLLICQLAKGHREGHSAVLGFVFLFVVTAFGLGL